MTKHCSKNDNKEKYYKIFYTLLLYFRANYEKEKVDDLLNNKEFWKYYIDIIPINHQFYSNIEIPNELIDEIFKQKILSLDIIKGTLSYISSNRNKLIAMNKNCDSFCEYCTKYGIILKIMDLVYPNEVDNLKEIIFEIAIIINYELEKQKQFISFNEEFWKQYLKFEIKKNCNFIMSKY